MALKYKKYKTSVGFIPTTPLPSVLELEKLYRETYYQMPKSLTYKNSYDALEIDYKNLKCNALINTLNKNMSLNNKSFLDVGVRELK